MDIERPPNLRTAGETGGEAASPGRLLPASAVNAVAELVADLLAATNLLPEDKLNVVRGRAGQGSLARAIVDEGCAGSDRGGGGAVRGGTGGGRRPRGRGRYLGGAARTTRQLDHLPGRRRRSLRRSFRAAGGRACRTAPDRRCPARGAADSQADDG